MPKYSAGFEDAKAIAVERKNIELVDDYLIVPIMERTTQRRLEKVLAANGGFDMARKDLILKLRRNDQSLSIKEMRPAELHDIEDNVWETTSAKRIGAPGLSERVVIFKKNDAAA